MNKRQQDKRNKNDMAQQAITLKIAGKSYSLNIESEKEEVYRLAEREVNNYLAAIKQNNFKNWTDQDYLSMAALKFAIANVDMRQSRELGDEDLKHLGRLGEELERLPQHPATVTEGKGQARDLPGQTVKNEVL